MHDDAMQNVMLEYDNEQLQEWYVHYDAMKRCLCDAWYECMLEIKCGSDLIRIDLWSKKHGINSFYSESL